jgi:hypothetical protein
MKQRFTRVAVVLLAVVTLGLTAGAVIPVPGAAMPAAIPGCQERTIGDGGLDGLHWSQPMMGHITGSYRVSADCSHQIKYWSRGWRFDPTTCGDARVHLLTASGGSLRRTDWTRVCGGPESSHTYTLVSFLPTNQRFELEFRSLQARSQSRWPLGVFRF